MLLLQHLYICFVDLSQDDIQCLQDWLADLTNGDSRMQIKGGGLSLLSTILSGFGWRIQQSRLGLHRFYN